MKQKIAQRTFRIASRFAWSPTFLALALLLFWSSNTFSSERVKGEKRTTIGHAQVKISDLAKPLAEAVIKEKAAKPTNPNRRSSYKPLPPGAQPPNRPVGKSAQSPSLSSTEATALAGSLTAQSTTTPAKTTASFQGLLDNGSVDYPNTQGAVGPNHLMVATDSQIRYQTREGGEISTVSTEAFWAPVGGTNVFDVRLLYDPYGQRWIMSADAFPQNPPVRFPPLLLIGVSQSTDPSGAWNLYKVNPSAGFTQYPDLPNLGFNKDWIVLQSDMYSQSEDLLLSSDIYVFDKARLYSGDTLGAYTLISRSIDDDVNGHVPAATYDPDLDIEYLMAVWTPNYNGLGYVRIYKIVGPVGYESLEVASYPEGYTYWDGWADQPNNSDFFPQISTTKKIWAEDSRLGNVVFREGMLWTTHTIFQPVTNPTRGCVQYWGVLPSGGDPIKQEIIQDMNSTYHYAYPSIAVNRNTEVLLGYSTFAPNLFAGAAYSFCGGLPLDTLQMPVGLKAGEDIYVKTNWYGAIKWGKYSAAAVDPVNDTEMWALQEYAATRTNNASRWGLWWGRVTPPSDLALGVKDTPDPVLAGNLLTYTLYVTNMEASQVDGVIITNTLPPDSTVISVTPSQGSYALSDSKVICDLGRLQDAQVASVSIAITCLRVGSITNVATVSARGNDKDPADNRVVTTTQVTPTADLGLTTTATPDPVTASNTLTYVVQVTNSGPSGATGVYITNTYPNSASIVSFSASLGTPTRTNNTIIWALLNSVNVGSAPTLTIVVKPLTAGFITNRAVIRATSTDLNAANNSSVTVTRVNASPTMQVIANRAINEDTSTGPIAFTVGDRETAASALTITAESSNESLIPNANIIPGGSASNRTINITPVPELSGSATITRIVTDSDGASTTNSFVLTVASVNDFPTVDPLGTVTLAEDFGTYNVTLSGIGSGAPNEFQVLSVTAVSSNTSILTTTVLYTSPQATGTLVLTSVTNGYGLTYVTVRVNDGGASNNILSQTFTVNVTGVNDLPVISSIASQVMNEDASLTLPFTVSDPETPAASLAVSALSLNEAVIATSGITFGGSSTNRTVTIRPVTNQFGAATIQLTVQDGNGATASTSFDVTVQPVNDPPTIATPASLTFNEDTSVTLLIDVSDAESPAAALTVNAYSSNLVLVPTLPAPVRTATNWMLTILPATNQFGTGSITIFANDGASSNNLASRTVTLNVSAVNDWPSLAPIGNLALEEDPGQQTVLLAGITAGPANEPVTNMTITAISSAPVIIPNPTIAYTNGLATALLRFTPLINANGSAQITVRVNDGAGSNNIVEQSFMVTLNPVNDPPTLDLLANLSIPEDAGQQLVNLTGISSGAANENQTLTVTATSPDTALISNLQVNYLTPANSGTLSFGTVSNASGTANITVTVNDGAITGNTFSRTFSVTINPWNDPPTLVPISNVTLDEDFGTYIVPLSGISAGPANEPQSAISITATSSNPALISAPIVNYTPPSATGSLTLNSLPNAFGNCTITVRVNDGATSNNILSRTFSLTVNPINDLPAISSIADQSSPEDVPLVIPFTIGDVETSASNLQLSALSYNEEVVASSDLTFSGSGSNRTVTVRPLPDQYGSGTIEIMVEDADGSSASIYFEVSFQPVNDEPRISSLGPQSINQGGAVTLSFTAFDVETPTADLQVSVSSDNQVLLPPGALLLNPTSTNWLLRVSPPTSQWGTANISIRVNDGAMIATRTFALKVNAFPTLAAIGDQATFEDVPLQVLIHIADAETPAGELLLSLACSDPVFLPTNYCTFSGTGADRTLTITPVDNRPGAALITITLRDADGASVQTSFTLRVNALNDSPTISPVSAQNANENGFVVVPFTIGDSENNPNDLVLAVSSSNPALLHETGLVFGGTGAYRTLTIIPLPNQSGSTTISLTVVDLDGASTSTAFPLTVAPGNTAPTISPLPNMTINEDTKLGPLYFTVGDLEIPPTSLTVSASAGNTSLFPPGSVVVGGTGADRTLSATPATNQSGSSSITLTVTDGLLSNAVSFTLTVNAVNDPPTLNSVSDLTINADSGFQSVPLSAISSGAPGENQTLSITAVSDNTALIPNPTVNYTSPNPTGSLSFTPALHASGTANITVTLNDGQAQNNIAVTRFMVTVRPVNVAPTISAIAAQTLAEDSSRTVFFTISDPETPTLALVLTATSTNSTLLPNTALVIDGSESTRTLSIFPVQDQVGTSLVTVTVSDGSSSNSTSFVVTVNAANDAPTITQAPPVFLKYNPGTTSVNLAGITSGAGNENQTLSLSVGNYGNITYATAPSISYTNPNSTAVVSFRPANNSGGVGTNRITVTVNDGAPSNNITTMSFMVYVRPNNSVAPPIASGIANQSTSKNTPTAPIPFTVRSAVVPANLISVSGFSSNPLLVPNSNITFGGTETNRTVTLTPASGQVGVAQITVSVLDTNKSGTNVSFNLTVTNRNTAPVITGINNVSTNEDSVAGPIAFSVADADTPAGNLGVTATSANATIVANTNIVVGGTGTNRALLITPLPNATGSATINLVVSDGIASTTTNFVVTFNPINDPPVVSGLTDQHTTENSPTPPIPFVLSDIDTPLASVVLSTTSDNTALVPNANVTFAGSGSDRTVTVTPLPFAIGAARITITASDGQGGTGSQSFTLTVDPVNNPPTLNPLSDIIISRAPGSNSVFFPLTGISSGAANENQLLHVSASSANPGLVPNPLVTYSSPDGTGSLTLTALGISNGTAVITVMVSESQGAGNLISRTFTATVNALPWIANIPAQVTGAGTATPAIPFTVGDAETVAGSLVVTAASRNTTLIPNANLVLAGSGANRTVTVTPSSGQIGFTLIDLIAQDALGARTTNSFFLDVVAVNHAPTLDPVADLMLVKDFGTYNLRLTGIGTGAAAENQILAVTAASGNTAVVPTPAVLYTNGSATGWLAFTSLPGVTGNARITIYVNDNATSNNLLVRTFNVTIASASPTAQLHITPGLGAVTLWWSATAGSFNLQSCGNLANATWTNVPGAPTLVNGNFHVIVPSTSFAKYYRLAYSAAATAPSLRVQSTPDQKILISWPVDGENYNLQFRTTLATGGWTNLDVTPSIVNGENQVLLAPSQNSTFYRLQK